MKDTLRKFYADLSRRLGNNDFLLKVYFVWFLAVVIIFGIFGIVPSIKNIYAKFETLKELASVKSQLTEKINKLQVTSALLVTVKPYIPYLDVYIPSDVNIQNYLLDFVTATSEAGYSVKSFVPDTGSSAANYSVTVVLEGNGDPQILVKNIEAIKRITAVNSLEVVTKVTGSKLVSLNFSIFSGGTQ